MKAMRDLESATFIDNEVRLGESVDETQDLIVDLTDKMRLLQSIHGEIEKVVKVNRNSLKIFGHN